MSPAVASDRPVAYDQRMLGSAARVTRNEAIFADANDRIAAVAGALPPVERVPFLCECPDPSCSQLAQLSLGEYAALRLYANRFLISPRCCSGELPLTVIVERTDRYTIVDRLA